MKKEGIFAILVLQLLTLVSAYGEGNGLYLGGFHLDINLLILAAVFLISFWVIIFVLRLIKLNMSETPKIVLALVLAAFSAYGAFKLEIDFQTIFFDLGINKLTTEFGPLVFVITAILIILFWNLSTFFFVYGAGFILLGAIGGLIEEVHNWGISIAIGIVFIIIGLIIKKKMGSKTLRLMGTGLKNILRKKEDTLNNIKKLEQKIKELEKQYMKIYNSNDPNKYRKLEDIKKQIEFLRQRLQELINQANQLNQQENQEVQRQQRERLNIQTQYDNYSNRIQEIMKRYNRKIPSASSPNQQEKADSAEYSRLSSAMRRIRKIAKNNGIQIQ